MNYISSNEKLIILNVREANLLRTGLIKIITDGIWGNGAPLHPDDKKYDEESRKLAEKMVDKLEDMLREWDEATRVK
jgi:hypothetical protein